MFLVGEFKLNIDEVRHSITTDKRRFFIKTEEEEFVTYVALSAGGS
jgi:hypothetical protein